MKMQNLQLVLKQALFLMLAYSVAGCSSSDDEWTPLFDGSNLDAWKESKLWKHEGDTIHRINDGKTERPKKLDDLYLVSKKEYKNFELKFEWRISDKGRSGLKYRYTKGGLEYQILDDISFPDTAPVEQAAALVWVKEAKGKKLKSIASGEFNKARIVANNGLIQHWLNGNKVMEINMDSDEWLELCIKNKGGKRGKVISKEKAMSFKVYSGHIKLQECEPGTEIWFKNIYIKELP